MRLPLYPSLSENLSQLVKELRHRLTETHQQINGISEGLVTAAHNAATSAPTTGTWAQGDVIRNKAPSELGSAGSKYIITGWACVASGTPGTWLPLRSLTGN